MLLDVHVIWTISPGRNGPTVLTFHTTNPVWRATLLEAMTVTDDEEELVTEGLLDDEEEEENWLDETELDIHGGLELEDDGKLDEDTTDDETTTTGKESKS